MRTQRTPEQEAAVNTWIEQLQVPEMAQEAVRNKFYRLNQPASEIQLNLQYLLNTSQKQTG